MLSIQKEEWAMVIEEYYQLRNALYVLAMYFKSYIAKILYVV